MSSAVPQSKTSKMAEEAIPDVTGAIGGVVGYIRGGTPGAVLGWEEGRNFGKGIAQEAHKFHDIYHAGEKDVTGSTTTTEGPGAATSTTDPTKSKSNDHSMASLDAPAINIIMQAPNVPNIKGSGVPRYPHLPFDGKKQRRRSHKTHTTKRR